MSRERRPVLIASGGWEYSASIRQPRQMMMFEAPGTGYSAPVHGWYRVERRLRGGDARGDVIGITAWASPD